jgi:hypothetical protein
LTGGAASRDLEPRKSHRERDALVAGKINLNKHNRIKFSVNANSGTGSGLADWAFTNIDLIYNPETGEFENTDIVGGFLAYEHNWSKTLASTMRSPTQSGHEFERKRTAIRGKADSDSSESGHFDGLVVMVSAFVGQVSVFVGIEFSNGCEEN